MRKMEEQELVRVEKTAGQTKELAITAIFLAIGAILRLASPSIFGITPNLMISMYCLAVLIIRADVKRALAIGIVAGVVCVATSKAIFPWANLISEPAGAVICAIVAGLVPKFTGGKVFMPGLSTFLGTLASGLVFITIAKVAMHIPWHAYIYGMLPVVLAVGAINCVAAQVLYYPAERVFTGDMSQPAKGEQ